MKENYKFLIHNFIIRKFIIYLWRKINSNPKRFAVYTNDLIIFDPILFNTHEGHIIWLIKEFTKSGNNNFFLDIGGNIGLISKMVYKYFNQVDIIEPNPECLNLLKINIDFSGQDLGLKHKIKIHEYGLSESNGEMEIHIPKNNLGGGFIPGTGNSYDLQTLTKKDGFSDYDGANYVIRKVSVFSADDFFIKYFDSMDNQRNARGVIKIDVEGREMQIIEALSRTLPSNISCIVIFESWKKRINLNKISNLFRNEIKFFSYSKSISKRNNKNRFSEFVRSIFSLSITYKLYEIDMESNHSGDIVMLIGNHSHMNTL